MKVKILKKITIEGRTLMPGNIVDMFLPYARKAIAQKKAVEIDGNGNEVIINKIKI